MTAHGFINLFKPVGPTSFDMIRRIKRRFNPGKIGHAGTLDPLASGVLPLALGRATRLIRFVSDEEKAYRFTLALGRATDTLDAEGETVAERDCSQLAREAVEQVLPGFVGEIVQTPPAFSAVKVDGERSYKRARRGERFEPPERRVIIRELALEGWRPGPEPLAEFFATCSKGTYIRSLAADIAAAAGCPGHVSVLTRTRVGGMDLEASVHIDKLLESDSLLPWLIRADEPLEGFPALRLAGPEAEKALNGASVPGGPAEADETVFRLYGPDGGFLGMAAPDPDRPGMLRPRVMVAIPAQGSDGP